LSLEFRQLLQVPFFIVQQLHLLMLASFLLPLIDPQFFKAVLRKALVLHFV